MSTKTYLILIIVSLAGLIGIAVYFTRLAKNTTVKAIHKFKQECREFIIFEVKL